MKDIAEVLDSKMRERGWKDADLARASGVYTGTIANVKTRNKIGPDIARKFAKAFEMREDEFFYELGLISQKPGNVVIHDPVLADIWRMVENMAEPERIAARLFLEKFFGEKDKIDEEKGGSETDTHGRGKSTNRKASEKSKS